LGDLVSYTSLKKEEIYGIITDFFVQEIRGSEKRLFAYAEIFTFQGTYIEVLLPSLVLKAKVEY